MLLLNSIAGSLFLNTAIGAILCKCHILSFLRPKSPKGSPSSWGWRQLLHGPVRFNRCWPLAPLLHPLWLHSSSKDLLGSPTRRALAYTFPVLPKKLYCSFSPNFQCLLKHPLLLVLGRPILLSKTTVYLNFLNHFFHTYTPIVYRMKLTRSGIAI